MNIKKIYIADDEENIRNLIKAYLIKEGYKIQAYEKGYAEAVKDGIYEDSKEPPEIIIGESERLKKLVEEIIYL